MQVLSSGVSVFCKIGFGVTCTMFIYIISLYYTSARQSRPCHFAPNAPVRGVFVRCCAVLSTLQLGRRGIAGALLKATVICVAALALRPSLGPSGITEL